MRQAEIDKAVTRATGESRRTVAGIGFSLWEPEPNETEETQLHVALDCPSCGRLVRLTPEQFQPLAQGFANLITLSRSGWRETDLKDLLPRVTGEDWNDLQFATLRRVFRAHLVRRGVGGQFDFFHQQMRQAVRRRNLADISLVRRLHNHIADYLAAIPAALPLRSTELMFHLIGTDDRLRTAHYYAEDLKEAELAGATRALADHIVLEVGADTEAHLGWVLSLPAPAPQTTATGSSRLSASFHRRRKLHQFGT